MSQENVIYMSDNVQVKSGGTRVGKEAYRRSLDPNPRTSEDLLRTHVSGYEIHCALRLY